MRVTVLGKSPSYTDAGGACSGYLVDHQDTTILLDCGSGVFAKLRAARPYEQIDAVVITHLHADHFLDLVPYAYALTYAPRQQPVAVAGWPGTDDPARPRLLVPPGVPAALRRICGTWGPDDLIDGAFEVSEYDPAATLAIGGVEVRFCEVPHFTTTYAVEMRAGGARFTFGADCRPNDELVDFARRTDLLLIEATLPRPERTGIRGHLTPAEAGEHARRAGAKRAVITHISDELDPDWAVREAAEAYGSEVALAREGATFDV